MRPPPPGVRLQGQGWRQPGTRFLGGLLCRAWQQQGHLLAGHFLAVKGRFGPPGVQLSWEGQHGPLHGELQGRERGRGLPLTHPRARRSPRSTAAPSLAFLPPSSRAAEPFPGELLCWRQAPARSSCCSVLRTPLLPRLHCDTWGGGAGRRALGAAPRAQPWGAAGVCGLCRGWGGSTCRGLFAQS